MNTPKLCRNGLHPKTDANRFWRSSKGHAECLWCYSERQERKRKFKVDSGYCRSGKHKLSGTNAYVAPDGRVRCRACMAHNVEGRRQIGLLVQVKCPVSGCRARTWRCAETANKPYVCPKHRDLVKL